MVASLLSLVDIVKVLVTTRHRKGRKVTAHRDVLRVEQYPTLLAVTYADIGRESGVNTQYYPRKDVVRVKIKGVVDG